MGFALGGSPKSRSKSSLLVVSSKAKMRRLTDYQTRRLIYAHELHKSLPAFWRPAHGALVWQGHHIGQTVQARRSGVYLWGCPRDARHGRARGDIRSAEGQDPGEPVLRAIDANLILVHRGDGETGRLGHPDQRGEVFLGLEG